MPQSGIPVALSEDTSDVLCLISDGDVKGYAACR